MKKTGKKLFAALMGTVLALNSMSVTAFAEQDNNPSNFSITFDANGGTFESGEGTRSVSVDTAVKETVIAHSDNVDEEGGQEGTLSIQNEKSVELFSSTTEQDGQTYHFVDGEIEAHWQTGPFFSLDLVSDGESILGGASTSEEMESINLDGLTSPVSLEIQPGEGMEEEAEGNDYYGYYVKSIGHYGSPADADIEVPTRDGYDFAGWTDESGNEWDPSTAPASDQSVFASWSAAEYAITYEGLDGASDPGNPDTYTPEDEFTLNNPEKPGYDFAGWVGTELGNPVTEVTIPAGSTGNREYEATWTPTEYAITYDGLEDAEDPGNPTSVTVEDDEIALNNPTKDGYIFTGWTETTLYPDPTTDAVIPAGTQTELVFTAHWEQEAATEYKISYDLDGGNWKDAPGPENYSEDSLPVEIPNPVKEGYTFDGWSGEGIDGTATDYVLPEGTENDIVLTANWTQNAATEYTIDYDLDGGEWEDVSGPDAYSEDTIPVEIPNPVKTGYTFDGWTGTTFDGVIKDLSITEVEGDIELAAIWTKDAEPGTTSYKITYDLVGGKNNSSNPKSFTENDLPITLKAPTRSGYTFKGWSGTDISGKATTVVIETTGNKSYTANWEKDSVDPGEDPGEDHGDDNPTEYSITYHLGGGSVKGNPSSYTSDEEITLNNPTRSGYTFVGWTGTGLADITKNVTIEAGSVGDREYTANWKKNSSGGNSGDNQGGNSGNDNSDDNQGGNSGDDTPGNQGGNSGDDTPGTAVVTGSLIVANEVKGTGANLDKKFKFTIGLTNNGAPVTAAYDCSGIQNGKINFKDGFAVVKLANGESITISGIPKGYVVTIDQEAVDGYSTHPSSRHATGTMTGGRLTATFTNEKIQETPTPQNGTTPTDSTTDTTTTTTTTPTVTPTPVTAKANLGFTHVTETDVEADKDLKFSYTLTVKNQGIPLTGSYTYTGTGSGTVAFSTDGKISFSMKDGQTLTVQGLPVGATYTIEKTDENDSYTLTKDREDGTISGDTMVKLTETKKGISATVTPSANSNTESGTVTATTTPDASLKSVSTGDQRMPFVWAGIAALGLVVVFVATRKKKVQK